MSRILLFLCVFQLLIVFAQYAGLAGNSSDLFKAGGSLGHPNVLAAFGALAFPFLLYLSFTRVGSDLRITARVVAVLLVLLMIILKSRSALLALVSGGIVFHFNGKVKYKMLLSVFLFLLAAGLVLWEGESSLGRCLIWRISFHTAIDESFWGAGFGGFASAYWPAQADFFTQNHHPRLEWVSGQPQWAYNELLEHWIEGGIPALLFYLLVYLAPLFFLLFRRSAKTIRTAGERAVLYALWNYVLISLTHFTGTVFPLVLLYFVFLGLALRDAALHFHFSIKLPLMLLPLSLLFAIFFLFNTGSYLAPSFFLRQYSQQRSLSETDYSKLKTLAWGYPEYTRMQVLLAQKTMLRGQPDSAYFFLNRGNQPVYELNAQLLKIQALLEMGRGAEAAALSSRLCRQAPNRIVPLYYFFKAEVLQGNADQALELAKALIAFQPKVENQTSTKIKSEAMNYLINQEYNRKLHR
ncbi:hypothetical protein [Roseimarinus sediminis]|uniref:hypothetical protein n=1 Tax=Roseimarinus sediminis TaxID=1610899 RepID=UPI003D1E1A50